MAKIVFFRRRKLGRGSSKGFKQFSKNDVAIHRSDKGDAPEAEVLIRWGCTANTGRKFDVVLNSPEAIHQVNNKLLFRMLCNGHQLAPTTWTDWNHVPDEDIEAGVIVRPSRHAQGKNLDLCYNIHELKTACLKYGEYYISKFIQKVAEYRVFVVQGRAVAVAQKTPGNPEDVAWNVAQGGRFDNVKWSEWPVNAVDVAIKAFNLTALDFGGVDVMVDANGNAYVLEINSAPSLTSPYRQECLAKGIDYLVANGKERLPTKWNGKGYLGLIHPAITDKAVV